VLKNHAYQKIRQCRSRLYRTCRAGWFHIKKTKDKLTGHIRFLSFAQSDDGVLFIWLEFECGGKRLRRLFRLDGVSVHPKQFNQLNWEGARLFSPSARSEFIARVQDFSDDGQRLKVVTRLGWWGPNFVLPRSKFGPSPEALLVHLDDAGSERFTPFRVGGTMEGWQEAGVLAIGNTRVTLFIAAAFSGPVAALIGVEQGGFMLVGDPITGKTTVNCLAGSVWGCHTDPNKARELDRIARTAARTLAGGDMTSPL
jgi:hypothetical protein